MISGPLTPRHGTTTGAVQTVAEAMAGRKYFAFENTSDTDMRLTFGQDETPSATVGFVVPANGGSLEYVAGGFVPTGAVRLFCASGSKTFTCYEG